jgi:glycosyltransferase involved in cell wall biosynthesis
VHIHYIKKVFLLIILFIRKRNSQTLRMHTKYPSITIAIPTYNEEDNLKECLESIFKQDYPKELLDVYIVDNHSTDNTLAIAEQYPIQVLMNEVKDAQYGKMMAFNASKGEIFFYMDADLMFREEDHLKKMIKPLLENPHIVGSFTKMYQIQGDNSLNRFLTYDPLQRDPVYEYFSPAIEKTIVEVHNGYFLCKYTKDTIPPAGRNFYWRKILNQTSIAEGKKFMELDNLVILVNAGYNLFAYVPEAGEYHKHVSGIKQLLKKRLRNIRRNYIPDYSIRYYKWFDIQKKKEVIKILAWIIYAHLIIPAFFKGIYKSIKYRDIICVFYEPFLTIVLTDIILYGFLSNINGWKMVFGARKKRI